jgi:hypothetical protein
MNDLTFRDRAAIHIAAVLAGTGYYDETGTDAAVLAANAFDFASTLDAERRRRTPAESLAVPPGDRLPDRAPTCSVCRSVMAWYPPTRSFFCPQCPAPF